MRSWYDTVRVLTVVGGSTRKGRNYGRQKGGPFLIGWLKAGFDFAEPWLLENC